MTNHISKERASERDQELQRIANEWASQIWKARSQYVASRMMYSLLSQLVEHLTDTVHTMLQDAQESTSDESENEGESLESNN